MQKPTLVESLSSTPMASDRQEVVITCDPNPDNKQPAVELKFQLKTIDGSHFVRQGFVTLTDRKAPNLKEYALPETGIFIYFSGSMEKKDDKIVSMLVKEVDTADDSEDEGHAELIEFLELTGDVEAIQAYRSLAFFWTSMQSGMGLMSGDLRLQMQAPEEEDGYQEEDEGPDGDDFGQNFGEGTYNDEPTDDE